MSNNTTTAWHVGHDVRTMYDTSTRGPSTTYLYCMTCKRAKAEAPAPVLAGRCTEHPAFDADYCPTCGTARQIGGNR